MVCPSGFLLLYLRGRPADEIRAGSARQQRRQHFRGGRQRLARSRPEAWRRLWIPGARWRVPARRHAAAGRRARHSSHMPLPTRRRRFGRSVRMMGRRRQRVDADRNRRTAPTIGAQCRARTGHDRERPDRYHRYAHRLVAVLGAEQVTPARGLDLVTPTGSERGAMGDVEWVSPFVASLLRASSAHLHTPIASSTQAKLRARRSTATRSTVRTIARG